MDQIPLLKLANQKGWNYSLNSLTLNEEKELASLLNDFYVNQMALTAKKTGKDFTIRYGCSSLPIPAALIEDCQMETPETYTAIRSPIIQRTVTPKVFTKPVVTKWDIDLIRALNTLGESDRPAGLITYDNYQIWVNQFAADLFKTPPEKLIETRVTDYWYPPDLDNLHRSLKQIGSKDKPLEFTYRAKLNDDLDSNGNEYWAELTSRYTVIDDTGSRLSVNLGMKLIPKPEPITV